jgi:DNA-binding transcriptional ArsR family regulator
MPLSHPLPDPLVELVARRFRVLGEPTRIRILDRLRSGEASVGELVDAVGSSQQNISRHLAVLHDAGVVDRHKDGTQVIYEIADDTVFALCETVCGSLARQLTERAQLLEGPLTGATGGAR